MATLPRARMASTRRTTSLIAGVAAIAALLAVPTLASANVYCVDVSGGDCTDLEPAGAVQEGLDDAAAHPGPDTVRLGAATYPTPDDGGFLYLSNSAGNSVSIIGSGQATTTLAVQAPGAPPGSFTQFLGINVFGSGSVGSSISDLTVTLPVPADAGNTNQQYRGIQMNDGTITDVAVTGPVASAINAFGIIINAGTLQDSTITLPRVGPPTNIGVANSSNLNQNVSIVHDAITADTAVRYSNSTGTATVSRSTLRPSSTGVAAQIGTTHVEDTIIDLGSFNNATGISTGFSNPATHLSISTADGVTIVGTGTGATGVSAFASTAGDNASATVTSSILDQSLDVPIRRQASNTATANVVSDYSNYDPTGNVSVNTTGGTGEIIATNQTNLTPGFVGGGDFHLLSSSPLIDIGDPAHPAPGRFDIDGDPREILGKDGCGARRDIGADEFVPLSPPTIIPCPPETSIIAGPSGPTSDNTPTFTFQSSEASSTFKCSVDSEPFADCTSPFTTPMLGEGPHSFAVKAIDADANEDPTPDSVSFTVDTIPPDTTILTGPSGPTSDPTPTFTFGSTEAPATFKCSLDGGAFTACSSGFPFNTLIDGPHTLEVKALDSALNEDPSPDSTSFTVDTSAPDTAILSGPDGPTSDAT